MSYRTHATRVLSAHLRALLKRGSQLGLGLGALSPVLALANPTGGTVIAGSATITNPNANGTVVKETSAAAIIDWQQFNIGKGQYVQFLQPSSSSIILNRVIGGAGSSIYGSLTGNGQIFLVNTNGVFFGKGSSIDAQGFLASTLDISDSDFLARNFVFDKSGSDASVINQGSITAHKGGYVVLAGDYTENDGVIAAQSGHIILASGTKSTLTLNGNSLVSYAVDQATLAQLAGVANAGKLEADGGTVIMTADVANLLKATVVNNTGLIEATSLSNQNGVIQLLATGGNIQNAGTLDVDATQAGQQGGSITLKGDAKTLLTDTSKITATGDGADGGRVEVSGDTLSMRGALTLGKGGRLLLDPQSIELIAGTAGTAGAGGLGAGTASSTGGVVTKIGVGFIETQLDAGATVAISAHNLIYATGGVDAINATGPNAGKGVLKFHTGSVGDVLLAGVDITIAGQLDVVTGVASFGHLQAGSISIDALNFVGLAKASTSAHGAVTRYSAKTTKGALTITAAEVGLGSAGASSRATVALNAKTQLSLISGAYARSSGGAVSGDLILTAAKITGNDNIKVKGTFQADATASSLQLANLSAGKGVTLAAKTALHVGDVQTADGNVTLTGRSVTAAFLRDGSGDATATATGGNMTVGAAVVTGGKLTLNAGTHALDLSGSTSGGATLRADDGVSITAGKISATNVGILDISAASGSLVIKGAISDSGGVLHHAVHLQAAKGVKLNHALKVQGNLDIDAGSLAYTGAGKTFSISDSAGSFTLDASIGKATAPAKYNVLLKDVGRDLSVGRSIYLGHTAAGLAANLSLSESGHDGSSSNGVQVARPGDSLTLSAAGAIALKGWNVHVGGTEAIALQAGGNAALSASGDLAHDGGHLRVQTGGSSGGSSVFDGAITLQAGGALKLSGKQVKLQAGPAKTAIGNGHASASMDEDVILKASGAVTLTGGASVSGSVSLQGGGAHATGSLTSGGHITGKVTAQSSVVVSGRSIAISGMKIALIGNAADATAKAFNESGSVTAHAYADVSLTATGNISLNAGAAGSVELRGGSSVGRIGDASAGGSKNAATALSQGDVSLKAGGALTLSGKTVKLQGGSYAGVASNLHNFASAGAGVAHYTASADVSLSAGAAGLAITGLGASGAVEIHAGLHAGSRASVLAYGGGSASVHDSAGILIATKGNLNLKGAKQIQVLMGSSDGIFGQAVAFNKSKTTLTADAGIAFTGANVTLGGKSSASVSFGGAHLTGDQMQAMAESSATAVATAHADLSVTASQALTISAAKLQVLDGYRVGAGDQAHADHTNGSAGAHAQVTATANDTISVSGALKFSGRNSLVLITGASSGAGTHAFAGAILGGAFVHASDALSLTAGSIKLQSQTGAVQIMVSGRDAYRASAYDSLGGSASIVGNGDINLTAKTGGLTLQGKTGVSVRGGILAAGGSSISPSPGQRTVAPAAAFANGTGAKAAVTGGGAIGIQAKGAIVVTASGSAASVGIHGGAQAASISRASADDGGVATLTGDEAVAFKAASVTVTAHHVALSGGALAARGARSSISASIDLGSNAVRAFGAGAKASLLGEASVDITATDVSLNAPGPTGLLFLGAGNSAALFAHAKASSGGRASIQAKSGVDVAATKALTLTAGSIKLTTLAGTHQSSAGPQVTTAFGGSGALSVDSALSLRATAGILTIKAGVDLSISGGTRGLFSGARVTAKRGGAVATFDFDYSYTLDGATGVSLMAGSDLKLEPYVDTSSSSGDGYHVLASASYSAKAVFNGADGLDIVTAGAFTAKAGKTLIVRGAENLGFEGSAHASHAGAKADYDLDGSLAISAKTIAFSGAGDVSISGGGYAGSRAVVFAGHGGSTAFTADAGVNLTAVNGISVKLLASNTHLQLDAGGSVGAGVTMTASNQGKAAVSADADLDLTVTGTKGTITLSTAKGAKSDTISLHAGSFVAGGFSFTNSIGPVVVKTHLKASHGGSATLTATGNVDLSAKGAVTINAGSAGKLTLTGGDNGAQHALLSASTGGKTALDAQAGVDVTAASLTLQAGGSLAVFGGGSRAGTDATVIAKHGGSAGLTAEAGVTLNVSGIFTAVAGQDLSFLTRAPGSSSRGSLAKGAQVLASGSGARAQLSAGNSIAITAGTVKLTGGTAGSVAIAAAGDDADLTQVKGLGSSVHAGLSVDSAVVIAAKGAFTITGHTLKVTSGRNAGQAASPGSFLKASGTDAAVSLQQDVHVALTAGGAFTLTGNSLDLAAGQSNDNLQPLQAAGRGTVLSETLDANLSITAASIKFTVAGQLSIEGGDDEAQQMGAFVVNGATVDYTGMSSVDITAAKTLTVAQAGGNLVIRAGQFGGTHVGFTAEGDNTQADYTLGQGVNLTAGGAISFTGAGAVTLSAGRLASGTAQPAFHGSSGGVAHGDIETDVKITGASIVVGHSGPIATFSAGTVSSAGLVMHSSVIEAVPPASFFPSSIRSAEIKPGEMSWQAPTADALVLGPLQRDGLVLNLETVLDAPTQQAKPALLLPALSLQVGASGCSATLVKQEGYCLLQY